MKYAQGTNACYASAARRNARFLSRLYDRHLESAGLTVSQFSILSLLNEHGTLKIVRLAELLIMERTTLVRAMKPLQNAGWVTTEKSSEGRSFDVGLTASGSAKVVQAIPLWAEAQADFEGQVGRDAATRMRDEVLSLKLTQ